MSIIIMEPLTAGKVPSVRIIQESFASGKGLRGRTLRDLLEGSYSGQAPQGWFRDPDISMDVAQVFIHRPSGTAVVAHRGTEAEWSDWYNNAKFAGSDKAYKNTNRFADGKKVQRAAEQKYGTEKVITVGHSQGGLLAELLGRKSKEVITLNKATKPQQGFFGSAKGRNKNQYDIRSSRDIVSMWGKSSEGKKNYYEIPAKGMNLLKEHSYDILLRKKNRVFGRKDSIVI